MIRKGTANAIIVCGGNSTPNGNYVTVLDVIEKTSGNYTELLVKRTNTSLKDLDDEGNVVAVYDEDGENEYRVYHGYTIAEVACLITGDSSTTITWATPLAEV